MHEQWSAQIAIFHMQVTQWVSGDLPHRNNKGTMKNAPGSLSVLLSCEWKVASIQVSGRTHDPHGCFSLRMRNFNILSCFRRCKDIPENPDHPLLLSQLSENGYGDDDYYGERVSQYACFLSGFWYSARRSSPWLEAQISTVCVGTRLLFCVGNESPWFTGKETPGREVITPMHKWTVTTWSKFVWQGALGQNSEISHFSWNIRTEKSICLNSTLHCIRILWYIYTV